jgi:hypothetical protein
MNFLNRERMGLIAAVAAAGVLTAGALIASTADAATIGEAAPAFAELSTTGETVKLSDFAGKTVVLEWTNDGCPFVRKHYDSGNMQATQAAATADGVVWLTVISSKPGAQGYATAAEADALTAKHKAKPTAVLLDPDGSMGRAYGAKTTPHMYVISPEGKLVYNGAIDSDPSSDPKDIAGATNYVEAALTAVKAGKAPDPAATVPYGCSVKY